MAIDDNTSYELTGAQVKDLANKIKAKAADNIFVGATSALPGSKGLVPAPQAADDTKFLSGDGTWKTAGGSSATVVYIEETNGGDYINMYSDAGKTTAYSVESLYTAANAGVVIFRKSELQLEMASVIVSANKRTYQNDAMYNFSAYSVNGVLVNEDRAVTEFSTGWVDGTTNHLKVDPVQQDAPSATKYLTTEYDPSGSWTSYSLWSPDVSQDPSEYFELTDVADISTPTISGDELFEMSLTSTVTIIGTDSIWTNPPDDYDTNVVANVLTVEKVDDNGTTGYVAWVLVRPLDSQGDPTTECIRKIYSEEYSSSWYVEADISLGGGGTTYTAGTNIQISAQNVISAIDTTYSAFTGATSQQAGAAGLVPAPTTSDPDKFLKGDGTWATPSGGGSSATKFYSSHYSDNSNVTFYKNSALTTAATYQEIIDALQGGGMQWVQVDNGVEYVLNINSYVVDENYSVTETRISIEFDDLGSYYIINLNRIVSNLSSAALFSSWVNKYTLPTASANTLGGIKVGNNLSISSGVLSASDALIIREWS